MSELSFAKQFLATIDKKVIKLPADHVSDPRKYPNQSPYILPKQTHPYPRKTGPTLTQQAQKKTVTATLKPMKAGDTVTLSDVTLDTTIYDIKSQYAQQTSLQQDKIKLLLNKKPTADLKTLKDLGVEGNVEFSIMIMGGSGATPRAQSPAVSSPSAFAPPPAPATAESKGDPMDIDGKTGAPDSEAAANEAAEKEPSADTAAGILKTEEFWTDLQGFLSQRLRDEKEGQRLAGVFREAARSKK
ncbi:putative Ubiquitin-like domain-containing protein [Septoria linicola]|nr:putative Ubiquitin-like domain-containing protein [Septoria linicola]